MTSRPLVKICGVTRVEDAHLAVSLGADLIGLNFFPPSPRFVALERARAIADAVRGRTRIVGVFVNASGEEIDRIDAALGLDLLQLHGDEDAAFAARFGGRALKVFRVDEDLSGVEPACFPAAWGFLFDVRHEHLFGGTGERWPYERLAALRLERPYLVAGGIGPDNVRQALAASGAAGVDACSGVESAPGVKDPTLLERLIREIRHHGPNPS